MKDIRELVKVALDHLDMYEPKDSEEALDWALAVVTAEEKLIRWLGEYEEQRESEVLREFVVWLGNIQSFISTQHLTSFLEQFIKERDKK